MLGEPGWLEQRDCRTSRSAVNFADSEVLHCGDEFAPIYRGARLHMSRISFQKESCLFCLSGFPLNHAFRASSWNERPSATILSNKTAHVLNEAYTNQIICSTFAAVSTQAGKSFNHARLQMILQRQRACILKPLCEICDTRKNCVSLWSLSLLNVHAIIHVVFPHLWHLAKWAENPKMIMHSLYFQEAQIEVRWCWAVHGASSCIFFGQSFSEGLYGSLAPWQQKMRMHMRLQNEEEYMLNVTSTHAHIGFLTNLWMFITSWPDCIHYIFNAW